MAAGDKATPPSVMWAQRDDKIYLTINLEDCKDPDIQLTEKKLSFSGKGGPYNEQHEVEIEFYGEIDVSTSKYVVNSRNIPMVLMRKEAGAYWPRLLSSKDKMHWLKTDFDKWRDEDEEEEEDASAASKWNMEDALANFDTNSMMPSMGDDEPEENDSDDEELPDLEPQ